MKVENCQDSPGCIFRQRKLSKMSKDDFSHDIWTCFPFDTVHYRWNIKEFGPFYVPASGSIVMLDSINIFLYKNLIEYETDKTLSVHDGSVFLGTERIHDYTFLLNYYFMAGDYIFDSQDSRYWGLLPEDCIIGKAILVWRSADPGNHKTRWKRFFKKIQ